MALDPRIPMMGQPMQLNSPLNELARAQGIRNMMQTNELNAMQAQYAQMQRAAQQQAAQSRQQALATLPAPPQDAPPELHLAHRAVTSGLMQPKEYIDLILSGSEVARTVERRGANGPETVQLGKRGNEIGAPMPKWVAPHFADRGGSIDAIDPTAPPASIPKTMAPGEAERLAISRTTAGAAQRQAAAAEDANSIQRGLKNDQLRLENEALQRKAGDATAQKQTAVATMEDSLRTLDAALKHPGRETATGVSGVADPRNYVPATEAKNYQILADQIKGKAFLQAFETLKGGGQITEVEGKKATDAIARLDRAQSDAEYAKALGDFRGVIAGAYKRATGKDYAPTDADSSSVRSQADAILRGGK